MTQRKPSVIAREVAYNEISLIDQEAESAVHFIGAAIQEERKVQKRLAKHVLALANLIYNELNQCSLREISQDPIMSERRRKMNAARKALKELGL